MSSSCAVQGVIKLKRDHLDDTHALYQSSDQCFDSKSNKELTRYLFGVNVSRYIETHFSEKAANGSFDNADFETGILTFTSGFSSYVLEEFIENIKRISESHILYIIFENAFQLHNEKVVIKGLDELRDYLPEFNNPKFIQSEIPFEEFDKDGTYYYSETENGYFGSNTESEWKFYTD